MNGIDVQLTRRIEQVLDNGNASRETVSALLAAVSTYLSQPVASELRTAAGKIFEISSPDGVSAEHQAEFRTALIALQAAIQVQKSQDEAAAQFAADPELVQEFLVEAGEHLASVEGGVLALEQDPGNAETINAIFRSFHTIKGLSGFLGAAAIQELAHETENVLDRARSGQLAVTQEVTDLILRSADELGRYLNKGRTQKLNELPRCESALLSALAQVGIAQAEMPSALKTEKTSESNKSPNENSVVRIETSKLEYLIDMVGELVIAESVVRHHPVIDRSEDPTLARNLTQLARVLQEVQKTSMSMRMVAVGTLFRKMTRLTRDLARKSGKNIELITLGDDVELDRNIVEELADPMVHMIRNAVDHGLELPGGREQAGKPAKGVIRLLAMHDAGDIVIEIADDGRGMDPARILARGRRLGLVGEQETPDEEAIFRLIFEPGFSTADKVTDMSGRGVGMDVVKKQIQKLRGRVSIRSIPGQGCTFVLRLPLTLAIIDGLVVGVGSERFILPMFAVREMFSPKPDTFVTLENRAEAALFRDMLLPVIRLSRLFGGASAGDSAEPSAGVLIVTEGRDQLYCIAVDQLIGKQEVVIKSLGKTFRDVPAISGGAILGDGRVGLIVDVNSLRYQS